MNTNIQGNPTDAFRGLWRLHITLLREFILAKLCDTGNLGSITDSIFQNTRAIADVFEKFYGSTNAKILELLLDNQYLIAALMIADFIQGDMETYALNRYAWYTNAYEISKFLSELNPNWDIVQWQTILYNTLYLLESELSCDNPAPAESEYNKNSPSSLRLLDQAVIIADYLAGGITEQFNMGDE